MSPNQPTLLLRNLGCVLIGAGIPLRFFLPGLHDTLGPAINVIPSLFLASGAGVLLLASKTSTMPQLPAWMWLCPIALLAGLWPRTSQSVPHGLEMIALALSSIAIFSTARTDPAFRRGLWHVVLAAAGLMAVIGCAQALWQAEQIAEFARNHRSLAPDRPNAEAFLASRRAAATLVSPNLFAGWLLLIIPAACTLRGGYRALSLLLIGGFGAAASAGATLSLLVASGLLICRGPLRKSWWPRVALAIGVFGFLLLLLSVVTGWFPPVVGHKVSSFLERADYNAQGMRMMPHMGVFGAGFHAAADLRTAVAKPMEASSVYLHNSWLQILIECGPIAFLLLTVLLMKAWRYGWKRCEAPTSASKGAEASSWPLLAGASLGCALSVVLAPAFLSFISLSSSALMGAAGGAVVFAGILLCLHRGRIPPPSPLPLLVGISGLILHGFLDYDLYSPAVVLALGIALALLGQPDRQERSAEGTGRPASAWRSAPVTFAALTALALPLPSALVAMASDQSAQNLRALRETRSNRSIKLTYEAALNNLPDPALWREAGRSSSSIRKLLDRLKTLPPKLRERPSWRRTEATLRSRWAILDPNQAQQQAATIATLIRPGERNEAALRYAQWRALRAGGATPSRLLEIAQQAVVAAGRFGLTTDEEPWLENWKGILEK